MWTILPTPGFSLEWRKKVFREVIDTEGPTYRQAGTFRMRFARLGWVSEEASSAQPLGVCCISFKEKLGFKIMGDQP